MTQSARPTIRPLHEIVTKANIIRRSPLVSNSQSVAADIDVKACAAKVWLDVEAEFGDVAVDEFVLFAFYSELADVFGFGP